MYFFLCAKRTINCSFLLTFSTLLSFIIRNKVIFLFLLIGRFHQGFFLAPASVGCPLHELLQHSGQNNRRLPSRLCTLQGKGALRRPMKAEPWDRLAEKTSESQFRKHGEVLVEGLGERNTFLPQPDPTNTGKWKYDLGRLLFLP